MKRFKTCFINEAELFLDLSNNSNEQYFCLEMQIQLKFNLASEVRVALFRAMNMLEWKSKAVEAPTQVVPPLPQGHYH